MELDIRISGQLAGTYASGPTSHDATFTYASEYGNNPAATPLSISITPSGEAPTNAHVDHFFKGLLPEGQRLDALARERGVNTGYTAALIEYIGRDTAGAIQATAAGEDPTTESGFIPVTENELRSLISKTPTTKAGFNPGTEVRFTLAGQQDKLALAMGDDGGFLIPTGNSPSTHILKPPHVEFPTLVHDEAVCMRAAAVIGLSTAETKLAAVGDSLCLLIERYDREKVNDHYVRIHQEDLCQALGLSPVEKDDVTLTGIGQLLDEKLPRAAALSIKKSLMDAHAFNAAIGANDAHGKNFSLILNGNSVHLAPLYDVISVLRVQRDLAVVNSPVAIGGETLFRNLTREHWLAAARELGINPDEALARVEHINSTAENAVLEAARQIELESMGLGFPNPGLVDSWREKLVEYRATARERTVIAGPAARPAVPTILAPGGASLVLCGKPTVDGSPCRRVGWCPFHQNH